ncbi:Coiled-coil and C2 domain-containing protein 1B, partial [Rhizoclosmatium hyalinum]
KRVVVDVLHQVKGWGGLSLLAGKPVPVGRASVALSGLLTKAEVHEVVDLVDVANPRKLVGGKLEIKLRLRVPLSKSDVVLKEERWVVVDFSGQLNTPAPTTPAPQQYVAPVQVQPVPADIILPSHVVEKTSNVEATDETSSTTVESTTSASTLPIPKPITPQPASNAANSSRSSTPVAQQSNPIKKASTPIPTNPAPSEVDIEELEMEFLNPDAIASNNVLESEHTALLAQIAAHKKPAPEDLMDRKAGYELRMNLLVTLVSTGALTMNKYIENVKTNIGTTKKQALLLKQHGKVELARQAMARIKIMMEEVEEVEKAIAAGEL